MRRNGKEWTLTRAEMEIMNILWDNGGAMSTHNIIDKYPTPKPAYSTVATFLRILTCKGFIDHRKAEQGNNTFLFYPVITRQKYTSQFMKEVKSTMFGNSMKAMFSFFAREEEISDDDLEEIINMIRKPDTSNVTKS